MYIYLLVCRPNNKFYVGKTQKTIAQRWKIHRSDAYKHNPRLICRAIRKYGVNAFDVIEIGQTDCPVLLAEMEKAAIELFESNNPKYGYNMTSGGDGCDAMRGRTQTPEHIQKRLAAKKANSGFALSLEVRAKISSSLKGRKLSDSHRKNISKSLIGNTRTLGCRWKQKKTSCLS